MSNEPENKSLLSDSFDASPDNDGPKLQSQRVPKSPRWIPKCWYKDCIPCIKARYVLSFMIFLGLCNAYALRVNLSVAIVPMTSTTNQPHNQRSVDLSLFIIVNALSV